jgi:hypothetical protein
MYLMIDTSVLLSKTSWGGVPGRERRFEDSSGSLKESPCGLQLPGVFIQMELAF